MSILRKARLNLSIALSLRNSCSFSVHLFACNGSACHTVSGQRSVSHERNDSTGLERLTFPMWNVKFVEQLYEPCWHSQRFNSFVLRYRSEENHFETKNVVNNLFFMSSCSIH